MAASKKCYVIKQVPDLSLFKYASLEEKGVSGVLEYHVSFLRQLNRKGILSDLSFHLFFAYVSSLEFKNNDKSDMPGRRLNVYLSVSGENEKMKFVDNFFKASPLSPFFDFKAIEDCSEELKKTTGIPQFSFDYCSAISKYEIFSDPPDGGQSYYALSEWETNKDGRLFNMFKTMEALDQTAVFRIDLYPVEKNIDLKNDLGKTIDFLRKRQEYRSDGAKKDYEGKSVLDNYEKMIETYDNSPHFFANILCFSNNDEISASVLDAAGAESLKKGTYSLSTFKGTYNLYSFLDDEKIEQKNIEGDVIAIKSERGLIICSEKAKNLKINYTTQMYSLEEIAPFFRLPTLFDGEAIQIPKETAPPKIDTVGSLMLGKDENGYDVYFPLKLLPKHAFISGVPGSGKTNTMHHITSTLWKNRNSPIPFLVLEPAKQEYRALLNDPYMKDVYLFSPNADMKFPLHINPFEMPKNTIVSEHIRNLCSVFEGAFYFPAPLPFILDTSIEAVYRECGWEADHRYMGDETNELGKKREFPTLSMLYRKMEEELSNTKYEAEIRGNMESALQVRVGSLLRREMGDVFDVTESSLKPEEWIESPAIIELESMGRGPSNFLTLLLLTLIRETLKANPVFDGDIRHVIFIEEAHNLIGPDSEEPSGEDADPKKAATAFIVKMLAEVRALKEGIVIADQLPTVMAPEVLKNTGLKLGMRITSEEDRGILGNTMSANAMQLEKMGIFGVGEALIFYEKLQRPFILRIKEWCSEIKNEEEKKNLKTPLNDNQLYLRIKDNTSFIHSIEQSIETTAKKVKHAFNKLEKLLPFSVYEELALEINLFNSVCKKYSCYSQDSEIREKLENNKKIRMENIYNLKEKLKIVDLYHIYEMESIVEKFQKYFIEKRNVNINSNLNRRVVQLLLHLYNHLKNLYNSLEVLYINIESISNTKIKNAVDVYSLCKCNFDKKIDTYSVLMEKYNKELS